MPSTSCYAAHAKCLIRACLGVGGVMQVNELDAVSADVSLRAAEALPSAQAFSAP